MAEPVGQYLFTDAHRTSIIDKIAGTEENIFGDKGTLQTRANAFSAAPSLDPYDWMDPQTPIRNCTNCAPSGGGGSNPDGGGFVPIPINVLNDDNEHNEDVYQAAIYAWATDDSTLGQKVIDRMLLNAEDDKLDFGNGAGANNPNATYSTATRYISNTAYSQRPFDQLTAWMKRNLDAYTLLHSRGLYTLNATDQQRLDGWFQDCYNWNYDLMVYKMAHHWGTNWRTDSYNLNVISNVRLNTIGGVYLDPPFANAAGTTLTGWGMSELVQTTLNNTRFEHIDFIGAYSLAYNISTGKSLVDDYFKTFMRFSVFPDGTLSEVFRGYTDGSNALVNHGTTHYCWVTLQSLVLTASAHATAKINSLTGMENEDAGYFFDFETSEGFSDFPTLSTYAGDDTSGGPKSIKNSIITMMKYIQQNNGSTYGWAVKRHQDLPSNQILGLEDNRRSWVTVIALANGYYNDPYLEDIYKQNANVELHSKKGESTGAIHNGAFERNGGHWGKLYGVDDVWANTEGFLIPSVNPPSSNIKERVIAREALFINN